MFFCMNDDERQKYMKLFLSPSTLSVTLRGKIKHNNRQLFIRLVGLMINSYQLKIEPSVSKTRKVFLEKTFSAPTETIKVCVRIFECWTERRMCGEIRH